MTLQALKGFKDVLPGESEKWAFLEQTARKIFQNYGYAEIKTPILEKTELFARTIGAATDIVEKEMYTFADRSGDSVTLRPEATASVLRAFIEHHLHTQQPLQKLFSIGPMFRHERPQKGRLRQFHQINAECLGSAGPYTDAEIILLLIQILKAVGLADIRLRLNSLGCPACRPFLCRRAPGFFRGPERVLLRGLPAPDHDQPPAGLRLQGGALPGIFAGGADYPGLLLPGLPGPL